MLHVQTNAQQEQLGSLDQQLARWQSVMREIVERKQSFQNLSFGSETPPTNNQLVRQHLRSLEKQVGDLRAMVGEADHDQWRSQQLRAASSAQLQEMQDTVYRVYCELSQSECSARQLQVLFKCITLAVTLRIISTRV